MNDRNPRDGNTPLIKASYCFGDECEATLKGMNPYSYSHLSWKIAKQEGFLKCTMLLINAGEDVNAINQSGDTALLATLHFGNVERVRELLAAGADVNKKNKYGDSTVTLAARYGHDESLNLLLLAGISHGEVTHSLINTAEKKNSKCIDLLLEAGADVNARSSTGETPLLLATKNQCTMSTQALQSLINAGADVNAIDRDQNTALHFAASFNHFKLLLLAGAHVNKVDNTGSTALQKCLTPSTSLPVGLDLNYRSKCLNVAEVLFAAGDSFNLNERITLNRPSVSKLKEMMVPRMDLKDMCRHKIRNHLLSIDSHINLFVRVPKLGLPHILASYVLFNQDEDL